MRESTPYQNMLKHAGLKVTPQRLAVLESIFNIKHHPSSEDITRYVRKNHPNIAVGTIYNILDQFVKKGLLTRVKTDKGSMLFDHVTDRHHHLYCSESERVEDYFDKELDQLLENFFNKKRISGFEIDDIRLQLVGHFKNKNSQS
ncbi:MAG: transcriptional repressor [Bacteroidales bacterium]|nr:transcriptional repressor [Bacteroidales bacterium]